LILLLILLPLTSVSIAIYHLNGNILQEEIGAAQIRSLSKVRDMMDMVMREVDRLSARVSMDRSVEQFLSLDKVRFTDYSTVDTLQNVRNILSISASDYIDSIYVYSDNSDYIITSTDGGMVLPKFYDRYWAEQYKSRKNKQRKWISSRCVKAIQGKKSHNYITGFFPAPLTSSGKNSGVVMINLDVNKLRSFISNNEDGRTEKLYTIDEQGVLLFSTETGDIRKKIRQISDLKDIPFKESQSPIIQSDKGINQVITQVHSNYNKWAYFSITPLNIYEKKMNDLKQLMWVSVIINLLISVVVSFLISVRVFMPIRGIMSLIDNPEEYYNQKVQGQEKVLNEYKYITRNILKSFDENRQMEEELTRRMSRLKQSQAAALQSQINPHFLYNTLQTINWLAMGLTGGENDASGVIEDLSEILRVTMETENYLIPIREEIHYAKLYIRIQQIRYKDKFTVHWEAQEEILDSLIAKISLQPLIENSIYHGIKPKKAHGNIWIRGIRDGSRIQFTFLDDGVGMEEEDMNSFNQELQNCYVQKDKHIGLRNVNQRLKLIFGEEYGITLTKRQPMGLQVYIVIPDIKQYL
jgi:two-component system sensor histidine kinase YesM